MNITLGMLGVTGPSSRHVEDVFVWHLGRPWPTTDNSWSVAARENPRIPGKDSVPDPQTRNPKAPHLKS